MSLPCYPIYCPELANVTCFFSLPSCKCPLVVSFYFGTLQDPFCMQNQRYLVVSFPTLYSTERPAAATSGNGSGKREVKFLDFPLPFWTLIAEWRQGLLKSFNHIDHLLLSASTSWWGHPSPCVITHYIKCTHEGLPHFRYRVAILSQPSQHSNDHYRATRYHVLGSVIKGMEVMVIIVQRYKSPALTLNHSMTFYVHLCTTSHASPGRELQNESLRDLIIDSTEYSFFEVIQCL